VLIEQGGRIPPCELEEEPGMSRNMRFKRFGRDILRYAPFLKMVFLLAVLWLIFSAGLYFAERGTEGATITSYGKALYWGIAAFSTAGIADTPLSGVSQIVGGVWIVVGSILFFGTIVATVTSYFNRPLLRCPAPICCTTLRVNFYPFMTCRGPMVSGAGGR
jgi:hypothetical protein